MGQSGNGSCCAKQLFFFICLSVELFRDPVAVSGRPVECFECGFECWGILGEFWGAFSSGPGPADVWAISNAI